MMIDRAHSLNMLEIEQHHHYESTRAMNLRGNCFVDATKKTTKNMRKQCEKKDKWAMGMGVAKNDILCPKEQIADTI